MIQRLQSASAGSLSISPERAQDFKDYFGYVGIKMINLPYETWVLMGKPKGDNPYVPSGKETLDKWPDPPEKPSWQVKVEEALWKNTHPAAF